MADGHLVALVGLLSRRLRSGFSDVSTRFLVSVSFDDLRPEDAAGGHPPSSVISPLIAGLVLQP